MNNQITKNNQIIDKFGLQTEGTGRILDMT